MRATAYEVMTTCAPAMVVVQPAPGLGAGAVDDHGAQAGREPGRLALPRRQHRRRCHDEHRVVELAALVRPQHHREHLQRLAQAHVVGQHPAEAAVPQQRQPAEPVDLVGPQRRVEPTGSVGRLDGIEVEERARRPASTARSAARRRPSAASSSQSPACTTEIRSGSVGLSCSERASSTSARSASSSGRSSENHVPLSRMRCSCPRAIASMSGASGTSSPATVTEMPRSNQSVGRAVGRVGRRHLDERRVDRLAVVRGLADDGQLEPRAAPRAPAAARRTPPS